ncbi:MAG: hypothetical protein HDR22_10460 [Lachnospiraceae bacterium]|nr:hypothetical protein [Lachnospiraceae bacterium]
MNPLLLLLELIIMTFIWNEKLIRHHPLFKGCSCKGKIEKVDREHLTRDGKPYYVEVSYESEAEKRRAKIKKEWNDAVNKEVLLVVSDKYKGHVIRGEYSLDISTILGTIMVCISSIFIIERTDFHLQTGIFLIMIAAVWLIFFPDIYFVFWDLIKNDEGAEYCLEIENSKEKMVFCKKALKKYIGTSLLFSTVFCLLIWFTCNNLLGNVMTITAGMIAGIGIFCFRGLPKMLYVRKFNRLLEEGKVIYATITSIRKKAVTGIDKEVVFQCVYECPDGKELAFKKSFEMQQGSCEIVGEKVPVLVSRTNWKDFLILYSQIGIRDHLETSFSQIWSKQ